MKSRLAFFGIVFLLSSQFCLAQWFRQTPFPPDEVITSLVLLPDSTGWMINAAHTIYKSTDAGSSWFVVPSPVPVPATMFKKIVFTNTKTGFIITNNRRLITTRDGGVNWHVQEEVGSDPHRDITFSDSLNGWLAFGDYQKTTDGGLTWTNVDAPYGYTNLAMATPQIILIWRSSGISRTSVGGGASTGAWSPVNLGIPGSASQIHFQDANIGWLSAENKSLFKTTDAGATWQQIPLPGVTSPQVCGIAVKGNNVLISSTTNIIYKSSDGGNTWTEITLPIGQVIIKMAAGPGNIVVGYGSGNTLLRSTDFGDTWTLLGERYSENFNGVSFTDLNHGWVAGSHGMIIYTTNSGHRWSLAQSNQSFDLYSIHFPDNQFGWVCGDGGVIMNSSDGGLSWQHQSSNVSSTLYAVRFETNLLGITVGFGGRILRTTDGGATWSNAVSGTTNHLYSIAFISPNYWMVVGSGNTVLTSTDKGITWVPHSTPVSSTTYKDVYFIDEMHGWISGIGTGGNPNFNPLGVLIRTTDGGQSWTYFSNGINGYNAVAAISPYDVYAGSFHGWIHYSNTGGGNIIHQTLQNGAAVNDIIFVTPTTGWAVSNNGNVFKTTSGTVSTSIDDQQGSTPEDYSLLQNYPNPFNPSTVLTFTLPQSSHVRLDIYDITGRKIQTLVNENLQPGTHTAEFNASAFSSGIYIAKITAGSYFQTVKMTYLK